MAQSSGNDLQTGDGLRQRYDLACALRGQGRLADAEAALRSILSMAPDHVGALCELARLCLQTRQMSEAVQLFSTAAAHDGASAEIQNELGIALAQTGKLDEAIRQFETALALAPAFVQALNNLGNAYVIVGKNQDAIACFKRLLVIEPNFPPALYNHGRALAALGRLDEAVEHYRKAVALNPTYVAAYNNLGYALRGLGRQSEALAAFDRALAIDPNYGFAHAGRASIMEALGRLDEARASLERAAALLPDSATFHSALAEIKTFRDGDPQIAAMESLLGRVKSEGDRIELHIALAKAYDDLKQYDRVFSLLKEGNAAKRRIVTYDEKAELRALRRWESTYTAEAMTAKRGRGDPSDVPVFVIGMPRSGTSLVEQILASHPRVFGAGERTAFQDEMAIEMPGQGPYSVPDFSAEALGRIGARYVAGLRALAPFSARIVDKLPGNFVWAGLIHLALPRARLIHIRRDAMDTCFSCFTKTFAGRLNYTYDLGELGRYYRAYERLMAHWRSVLPPDVLLEIDYEALVDDVEGQAKRLVAFVGLDWDARCLEFHKTERQVHTASVFQVRQPLYRSSIGRWRHYEAQLSPLREALEGG